MRPAALVAAAVVAAPALRAQDRPPPSVDAFWTWFRQHDAALFAVVSADEPVCDTLMDRLHAVNPVLTFELGPVEAGRREFVISADGIREAFPAVEALARAAPTLARWRITAFRPRRDPMAVTVAGLTVQPSEVEVLLERDGDQIALVVSIVGYRTTSNRRYEQLGYLILDQALGEYTMETRIGGIDFVGARDRPAGAWHDLSELPALVDGWR